MTADSSKLHRNRFEVVEVRRLTCLLIPLARVPNRVVKLRPFLALVFGFMKMTDRTKAVCVTVTRLGDENEGCPEVLVDTFEAALSRGRQIGDSTQPRKGLGLIARLHALPRPNGNTCDDDSTEEEPVRDGGVTRVVLASLSPAHAASVSRSVSPVADHAIQPISNNDRPEETDDED